MPPWYENEPWIVVQHRRRRGTDRGWPDTRTRSPRRSDHTAYASVTRRERGEGGRDFFHPWQRKWSGEPRIVDRYAAHQRERAERDRITDRESTQHKRYVNSSRTGRAEPPQKKIQSDDPDFSAKVRIIHKLIKTVHHLKNVSGDIPPPSLNKITHNLMTVIKPAIPNTDTQDSIEDNAKSWAHTTIMILRDHYNERMEEAVKTLLEFPEQDWRGPFEMAASWAKRNLGRRLQPESLEQTEAIIVAKLTDVQITIGSTERSSTINEPHHQPQVNEEVRHLDMAAPLIEVSQSASLHTQPTVQQVNTDRTVSVTVQVHAPPTVNTTPKTTTAKTSDPIGGEQSLSSRTDEGRDGDLRPAPLPVDLQQPGPNQAAPRDQRVRRTPIAFHGIFF
ncbi:uncharacterized protein LOC134633358 [Pelmatolapia mariae]|uniref:uncharacterized protein LOC134633358 n=1 Tax=Pelmatolapia mariae TaxID=158779 RepID=UPI002FE59DFF